MDNINTRIRIIKVLNADSAVFFVMSKWFNGLDYYSGRWLLILLSINNCN